VPLGRHVPSRTVDRGFWFLSSIHGTNEDGMAERDAVQRLETPSSLDMHKAALSETTALL